jgi:hypothetical protein
MAKFLQLTLWNANSLTQHTEELKTFISMHNTDMLISEMHFTEKSYIKLPNYAVDHKNNSAGTARGGTAIIIIIIFHQASPTKQPQSKFPSKQLVCQ